MAYIQPLDLSPHNAVCLFLMNRFSVCGVVVVSFQSCPYLKFWPDARTEPMRSVYVVLQCLRPTGCRWNHSLGWMTDGKARPCFSFICLCICVGASGLGWRKCINNAFNKKAVNRSDQLTSMSLCFLLNSWLIFLFWRKTTISHSLTALSVTLMDQGKLIAFTDKCSMKNAFIFLKGCM